MTDGSGLSRSSGFCKIPDSSLDGDAVSRHLLAAAAYSLPTDRPIASALCEKCGQVYGDERVIGIARGYEDLNGQTNPAPWCGEVGGNAGELCPAGGREHAELAEA